MLSNTPRTTLKKMSEKSGNNINQLHEIIDESLLAHVAIFHQDTPMVIPMSAWRVNDRIYIHGAKNSRLIRCLKDGKECSLTFTLFDGWVLARSAYNHGAHYRSAMIFGTFDEVQDNAEKSRLLNAFIDLIAPNRSETVRASSESELSATVVLSMPLTEASVKISHGPVDDLPSDMNHSVWTGVLPYKTVVGPLEDDVNITADLAKPDYSDGYPTRWYAK
jgi:hypothetical protein